MPEQEVFETLDSIFKDGEIESKSNYNYGESI